MFWYIRYISGMKKFEEWKISYAEDKILVYTVSNFHPHIRYILGDMIPTS